MVRWAPLGVALCATTVVALAVAAPAVAPPAAAVVGLVALGVAGGVAHHGRLATRMAFAAPGAALVGFAGDLDHPDWMAVAAAASITIAAPLVADADTRWGRVGGGPVAFAVAAVGLFACVPDTEEARVLLAVAVAAAVASRVPLLRVLGGAGTIASTGVFVWIGAFDAPGRPSAFVGAVAALGLLVWEPIGVRLRGSRAPRVHGRTALLCVLTSHIVLAAYASRVVGLEQSVGTALALAVPAALAGIAIGVAVGAPDRVAATGRSTS